MRKSRGWVGNNQVTPVQAAKPSSISFQLNDSILFLKWIAAIGCVEGYKIYGGKSIDNLELIGETNTNNYTKQLNRTDNIYFIAVSTFYGNTESDKTNIIKVRDVMVEEGLRPSLTNQPEKVLTEIISEQMLKPLTHKEEIFPYSICSCCLLPQPLMKRKEKIVCSRNTKQIYIQNGSVWVIQPQQIVSDIDQMDELLRQNSAYVGIGGVLVNNSPKGAPVFGNTENNRRI